MSIFCDLLRCLLCCEDEHDNAYHSLNQFPAKTASNKRDYYYETSHRNTLQPFISFTPAASPLKPPSTQYNHVLSPFSSSSSSPNPKPPSSLSKPPQVSSINTSSLSPKSRQPFSFDSYSTSLRTPTYSTKLPQSTFVNSSESPLKPPTSSFKPSQSFSSSSASPPILSSSSSTFHTKTSNNVASSKPPQASSGPNSPSPKPPTSSPKPSSSSSTPTASSKPSSSYSFTSSSPNPPTSSFKPQKSSSLNASSKFPPKLSTSSSNPPPASASKPCPSSSTGLPVSSTKLRPMFKPVLSHASSDVLDQMGKKSYVWLEKDSLPIFAIPDNMKDLIKNDIAPKVLNQPLSPATYKDYFAALLYAEDFYYEKWTHFDLENVTVELQRAAVYKKPDREEKTFVAFDMASFPENRPFLLSRDLVHVRPSGTNTVPFQGIIYRVVKSSVVLVEFEDDFYVQHYSTRKYDVSFSFNRVCLKRAHQAVQNASDALFRNFLFPESVLRTNIPTAPVLLRPGHKLDCNQLSAVRHILSICGSPPYLLVGQLCVKKSGSPPYLLLGQLWDEKTDFRLSRTGVVVSEAVHQLCQTSHGNRILVCAPSNLCCDGLMRSLLKWIPESDMFRANAAFREKEEVPEDILPSCLYKETCFSCPPTEELCEFRVIFSTFMSSFRLHDKGLTAGHFSHIFLVDASSAIEPETLVALTSFADKNTTVIVTGEAENRSRWVRADMARKKGLKISLFERLSKSVPYCVEASAQCSSHNWSIIKSK